MGYMDDKEQEEEIERVADLFTVKYPKSDKPSGKWIEVHPLQEDDGGSYECSVCGWGGLVWKPTNYCPACGAKMVEEQGENTDG